AKPGQVRVLAAIDPGEHATFTLAEAAGRGPKHYGRAAPGDREAAPEGRPAARKFTTWAKERLLAVVPRDGF
ncbi:unnamed protein product, partial [Symbiodinium sp. CCMP2592]